MRAFLTALVLFGAAAAVAAQSHGGGLTDDMPTPSIGLPLPHIGLPLPPLGLPLPQLGLPPARLDRPERFQRPFERPERPERFEGSQRLNRSRRPASIVFFGWPYLPVDQFPSYPMYPTYPTYPIPVPQVERATGRLRFLLNSGVDPQIFVDGYYAGLFSDVAGELTLDAGAHTIELREEGYERLRLPVNIQPDQVMMYDVGLTPIVIAPLPAVEHVAEPAPPAPPPTTIYVIPGCYVGNVPPREVTLPGGCDARNAIEFPSH